MKRKIVVVPSRELASVSAMTYEAAQNYVPPAGTSTKSRSQPASAASQATYASGMCSGVNRGRARRRTK